MENATGSIVITKSPTMLREFLEDKFQGKITQLQLEESCHYWAYDHAIQEFQYIPLPSEPLKLREWRGFHLKERERASEEVKAKMQELETQYSNMKTSIQLQNREHLAYLKEMLGTFKKYGAKNRIPVVEEKISGHKFKI